MRWKTLGDAQESMGLLGYDSLEEMYEAEEEPYFKPAIFEKRKVGKGRIISIVLSDNKGASIND